MAKSEIHFPLRRDMPPGTPNHQAASWGVLSDIVPADAKEQKRHRRRTLARCRLQGSYHMASTILRESIWRFHIYFKPRVFRISEKKKKKKKGNEESFFKKIMGLARF